MSLWGIFYSAGVWFSIFQKCSTHLCQRQWFTKTSFLSSVKSTVAGNFHTAICATGSFFLAKISKWYCFGTFSCLLPLNALALVLTFMWPIFEAIRHTFVLWVIAKELSTQVLIALVIPLRVSYEDFFSHNRIRKFSVLFVNLDGSQFKSEITLFVPYNNKLFLFRDFFHTFNPFPISRYISFEEIISVSPWRGFL